MIEEKEKKENITTSITIPESLLISSRIQAVKERTTFSGLVRKVLREYLEEKENEEGKNV